MLQAILNKSWRQYPTRHQLYGHLPPITKTIQVRRTRLANTAGKAGTSSLVMYSYGPPHMAGQKQDDQLEHTFSSYVRIRDVALKTYQRRWTIGRSGERGSGISVLAAWHDDDDDTWKISNNLIIWYHFPKYSSLFIYTYSYNNLSSDGLDRKLWHLEKTNYSGCFSFIRKIWISVEEIIDYLFIFNWKYIVHSWN